VRVCMCVCACTYCVCARFALLCFALLCFALLCFALLCLLACFSLYSSARSGSRAWGRAGVYASAQPPPFLDVRARHAMHARQALHGGKKGEMTRKARCYLI
jgi:hypothetical protein